jgi:transglutaminase-like putative cysteine protease
VVRLQLAIHLSYSIAPPGADFIFTLHCAQTPHQSVVSEQLLLSQPLATKLHVDPVSGNRCLRLSAGSGPLQVSYSATVDLQHHSAAVDHIAEVPVAQLPPQVLVYLYPSRYCPSDRLAVLAMAEFGRMPHGYPRVLAIQDWVRRRVRFQSGTSTSTTSALDTLTDGVGVCRDFAHLMIALCRALSIPARFTTGIDYGADPALGPTDFHAYVEVYLGQRWYLFDPSGTAIPMGFVRLGTGRDAADVSYATIFGSVQSPPPLLQISALSDASLRWTLPQHTVLGLSTDPGP